MNESRVYVFPPMSDSERLRNPISLRGSVGDLAIAMSEFASRSEMEYFIKGLMAAAAGPVTMAFEGKTLVIGRVDDIGKYGADW